MAVSITVAEIRARFPEYADTAAYPDAEVTEAIAEALELHAIRKRATMFVVAHLLAIKPDSTNQAQEDGGSGVVTSERIGPQWLEYLTQAGSGDDAASARRVFFVTTSYGRRFLALESRSPRAAIGARVIG